MCTSVIFPRVKHPLDGFIPKHNYGMHKPVPAI